MVCNVTAGLTNGASDTLAQNEAIISDTFGHFLHSVQHITTSTDTLYTLYPAKLGTKLLIILSLGSDECICLLNLVLMCSFQIIKPARKNKKYDLLMQGGGRQDFKYFQQALHAMVGAMFSADFDKQT